MMVTSSTGQTTTCGESGASPKKLLKIRFSVLFGSPLETTKAPCLPKLPRAEHCSNLAMQNATALQGLRDPPQSF